MRKNLLLLLSIIAVAVSARAELNGDGYYRINNADSERYIYVYDNRGSLNYAATSIDLDAIQLWKDLDRAVSDPASVLYLEKHGDKYDIRTQGTGIYQMISNYVTIYEDPRRKGTYWAYGSQSGMTKYLCDGSANPSKPQTWMVGEGTQRRNWYITPIDAATDNYFGVNPSVAVGGVNYATLYADFPFSFASEGMKAYYVKKCDAKRAYAVIEEFTSGVVPANTPVIIACAGADKSDNRLNLGTEGSVPVTDNVLVGVYFNYSASASHINRVAYDANKMRVLGVTKDGELGMVTANLDYIPANTFYMPVPSGSPSDFKLVTQAQYDEIVGGINDVTVDHDTTFDVYNVMGVKVLSGVDSLDGLAPGIYIANGRKYIVR